MNQEKPPSRDWKSINAEYELSGISQKSFCQKNGINLATFQYHRRRLVGSYAPSQNNVEQEFVEIKPHAQSIRNDASTDTKQDWKLSISIMGVVAFEVRLG